MITVVSKYDGKDGVTLNQGKKTPTPKKKKTIKTAPVKLANIIATKSSAQQKTIATKATKRLAKTKYAFNISYNVYKKLNKKKDLIM